MRTFPPVTRVLYWLSDAIDDLSPLLEPLPDAIVRFTLSGDWPQTVDGVPVRPVTDLIDETLTDSAYFDMCRYVEGLGGLRGADGRLLREVRWAEGLSLWWGMDYLVAEFLWYQTRQVRVVRQVTTALAPRHVTVFGADERQPWLRGCVLDVLGAMRAEGGAFEVEAAPLERSRDNRRQALWRSTGTCRLGRGWYGPRPPSAATLCHLGARVSTREMETSLHIVTRSDACWYEQPFEGTSPPPNVLNARVCVWGGNGSTIGLMLDDGRSRQRLRIQTGRIRLGDASAPLRTDVYHVYTLLLLESQAVLYVDNKRLLQAGAEPSQTPCCAWGHFDGRSDVESAWSFVEWGSMAAVLRAEVLRAARSRWFDLTRRLREVLGIRLAAHLDRLFASVAVDFDALATCERWMAREHVLLGCWRPGTDPFSRFQSDCGAATGACVRDGVLCVDALDDVCNWSMTLPPEVRMVELRVSRRGGDEAASIAFALDDGTRRQTVYLGRSTVRLSGGAECALDTSVEAIYLLVLEDDAAHLFVDGQPRLVAPLEVGRTPSLRWGHLSAGGDVETHWRDFAWGRPQDARERRLARLASAMAEVSAALPRGLSAPFQFFGAGEAGEHFVAGDVDAIWRVPLTKPLPQAVVPPPAVPATPPNGLLLLDMGGELSWRMEDDGTAVVYDELTEGVVAAARREGRPISTVLLGDSSTRVPAPLLESLGVVSLDRWRDTSFDADVALKAIREAWSAWRRDGAARFPDFDGVAVDRPLTTAIESFLPYLSQQLAQASALRRCLGALRPSAVICSHFVTSCKHLIGPIRDSGARSVGLVIGMGRRERLFVGHFGPTPQVVAPCADVYAVWSEDQRSDLYTFGPLQAHVEVTGRWRLDTFAGRRVDPQPHRLERLGLPARATRLVVFGDVLLPGRRMPLLTRAHAEQLLRGMLAAMDDLHVVWKPWRGDDLTQVRELVDAIGHPRLHVYDPEAIPFHNVDLLSQALTVVSSPTSMLAEFAALGGRPLLLSLPETVYYYGQCTHRVFVDFCRVVRDVSDIGDALRDVAARPTLDADERQALARHFGPPDGCAGARVLRLCERSAPALVNR